MKSSTVISKSGPTISTTNPPTGADRTVNPAIWGLSSDNIASRNKRYVSEVEVAGRPSNMIYRMTNRSPWWSYYNLMDYYRSEVSILDTVIMRSVTEIFRYGIDFEPAFTVKCENCGSEYQNNVKVCPHCNSSKLRRPEEGQKDYFVRPDGTSFLDEVNDNQQTLKDLMRMYGESEYQNNQAYLLCVTGDIINEDGQLQTSYPLEFICVDPKFVRYLYDETAEPGKTYGFTLDDRNSLIPLPNDPTAFNDRTEDGRIIYPAYWQVGDSYGGNGLYWTYTKDEVYQDHWFRQSMTYGIPHWLSIEDDLLTYHFIEKHNLKKYQYGYVRKIVILPGFDEEVVQDMARGIQDVLSKNDNSIPIVGLPPAPPGVTPQQASTLELGTENSSDLIQVKNDIRDRICAQAGVPNLFSGDVMGSGGLNNESQQITTFDRYLMDKYDYADRALDWILSWFPKITDWKLRVVRPSKADVANKKMLEDIQVAQGMKNLGFQVVYTNGEFTYSEHPVEAGNSFASMDTSAGGRFTNFQNPDSEQNDTYSEVQESEDEIDTAYQASDGIRPPRDFMVMKGAGSSFRISQRDLRDAVHALRR